MTEEEAKTRWCPFARVASPLCVTKPGSTVEDWIGVAGANRAAHSDRVNAKGATSLSNPESARCIGSACMAWREVIPPEIVGPIQGFCGLAGRPA
jgi:hypothetical protein